MLGTVLRGGTGRVMVVATGRAGMASDRLARQVVRSGTIDRMSRPMR